MGGDQSPIVLMYFFIIPTAMLNILHFEDVSNILKKEGFGCYNYYIFYTTLPLLDWNSCIVHLMDEKQNQYQRRL